MNTMSLICTRKDVSQCTDCTWLILQYRTVPVYQLYRTPCAHRTGQDCTHFSLQKPKFHNNFAMKFWFLLWNWGTVQGYSGKSTVQGQCVQLVQYKWYTTCMCTGKVGTKLVQYLVEMLWRCFKWLLYFQVYQAFVYHMCTIHMF